MKVFFNNNNIYLNFFDNNYLKYSCILRNQFPRRGNTFHYRGNRFPNRGNRFPRRGNKFPRFEYKTLRAGKSRSIRH